MKSMFLAFFLAMAMLMLGCSEDHQIEGTAIVDSGTVDTGGASEDPKEPDLGSVDMGAETESMEGCVPTEFEVNTGHALIEIENDGTEVLNLSLTSAMEVASYCFDPGLYIVRFDYAETSPDGTVFSIFAQEEVLWVPKDPNGDAIGYAANYQVTALPNGKFALFDQATIQVPVEFVTFSVSEQISTDPFP